VPISFQLSITPDLNPVLARFQNADKRLLDDFSAGMMRSAEELRTRLAEASPVGKSEHAGPRVASSWMVQGNYLEFAVRNVAPQLFWVLKGNDYPRGGGSGDGYIYPRNGNTLAFDIDGQRIFARRVRATRPNDFVTPVRLAWQITHKAILGTSLKATVHWLARGA
jgi:hypothetical protein